VLAQSKTHDAHSTKCRRMQTYAVCDRKRFTNVSQTPPQALAAPQAPPRSAPRRPPQGVLARLAGASVAARETNLLLLDYSCVYRLYTNTAGQPCDLNFYSICGATGGAVPGSRLREFEHSPGPVTATTALPDMHEKSWLCAASARVPLSCAIGRAPSAFPLPRPRARFPRHRSCIRPLRPPNVDARTIGHKRRAFENCAQVSRPHTELPARSSSVHIKWQCSLMRQIRRRGPVMNRCKLLIS